MIHHLKTAAPKALRPKHAKHVTTRSTSKCGYYTGTHSFLPRPEPPPSFLSTHKKGLTNLSVFSLGVAYGAWETYSSREEFWVEMERRGVVRPKKEETVEELRERIRRSEVRIEGIEMWRNFTGYWR